MNRFEEVVRKKAEHEGWRVLRKGWPDFLLVKKHKILALEVKSAGGRLSQDQQEMMVALDRNGVQTWVEQEPLDPDTFETTLRMLAVAKQNVLQRECPSYDGLGIS